MKAPAAIVSVVAAVTLAFAVAAWPRLKEATIYGPPTPVKKWEFVTTKSIVQDCTKPTSPYYNYSTHRCDPRIPDSFPEHSPAIADGGTIYVGGATGLYALNPDGTQKWLHENQEFGINFQVPYQPVLYVFIADDDHIWFDFRSKYETHTAGLSRVDASGEGRAYVSNVGTVIQTGLLKDGSIFLLWDRNAPAFLGPDGVPPEVNGFVPNAAVRQEWQDREFSVPRDCHPPAFGADGLRYVGCKNELMMMKPTGTIAVWSFSTPGHWASQPAVAEDGTVYFGSEDGNVYALNPDGKLKWKFSTGDKVRSTPAIAKNGSIFFGSDDHYLYAIGPEGQAKWRFKTGGPVYSPTIGPDGTVYALSADGKLYALEDSESNGGLWGQWPKFAGDIRNDWRGPAQPLAGEQLDSAEGK
jgi:outer membrane protein assembly factor BamB